MTDLIPPRLSSSNASSPGRARADFWGFARSSRGPETSGWPPGSVQPEPDPHRPDSSPGASNPEEPTLRSAPSPLPRARLSPANATGTRKRDRHGAETAVPATARSRQCASWSEFRFDPRSRLTLRSVQPTRLPLLSPPDPAHFRKLDGCALPRPRRRAAPGRGEGRGEAGRVRDYLRPAFPLVSEEVPQFTTRLPSLGRELLVPTVTHPAGSRFLTQAAPTAFSPIFRPPCAGSQLSPPVSKPS